jgi:hypothetical protein
MRQLTSIELQAVSGGARVAPPPTIMIIREDFERRGRRFEREDNLPVPLPRRLTRAAA